MLRRDFLTRVGLLGSGVVLAGRSSALQTPSISARRVDLHHHFLPPRWATALEAQGLLNRQRSGWTPMKSLDAMDQSGTRTAMLSVTGNQDPSSDAAEMRKMLREANEYGATLVADHQGRFGLLAAVPLPDIDASLREIEYAFDVLHADGIGIETSFDDKWLGDPFFAPVFEELNRRRAVVYTHPTTANCCGDLIPQVPAATIEYGTDTTRTIMSLLVTGAAARYANVRFIFSHAGGTLPFLISRIVGRQLTVGSDGLVNLAATDTSRDSGAQRLVQLRRFFYDTAQQANPVAMSALRKVVPASQIVFGTDYPYISILDQVTGLQQSGVFTADELRAIDFENALKMFPKYRT
jgi:6-methylsalicylate decarboxylase